jgi:hypothetical protein
MDFNKRRGSNSKAEFVQKLRRGFYFSLKPVLLERSLTTGLASSERKQETSIKLWFEM